MDDTTDGAATWRVEADGRWPVMSAEQVATALVDAYNRHDLGAYVALHAADTQITFANAAGGVDLDGWSQVLAGLFTAVPDLVVTTLACGAGVTHALLELRQTGVHTGTLILDDGARALLACELDHIPPTGRALDTSGVVVIEVVDGLITTERHHWPPAWVYQQLGLVTVTPRPIAGAVRGPHDAHLPPPHHHTAPGG